MRLFKCGSVSALKGFTSLHIAAHVETELGRAGHSQRTALARLGAIKHPVVPGSAEWDAFCVLRGGEFSTADLGEDESLAICLAEARKGRFLPLVTFDRGAAKKAIANGVPTLDFLALLSWLVACGKLTSEEADAIEASASALNGWKRPAGYNGGLASVAVALRDATGTALHAWKLKHRPKASR